MNIESEQPKKDIKSSVLERLQSESITPTSRVWFVYRRAMVWTLWVLTILLGAVAVSVVEAVWVMRSTDIHEATHETLWEFLVAVTPFVWLLVFAAMVFLAYQNLRHTEKGYRYPFTHIVISSIGFSVVAGVLLQFAGLGMYVDKLLGEQMPMYMSQSKIELKLWQNPAEGRLVGVVRAPLDRNRVDFEDVRGGRWEVAIGELREADRDQLMEAGKIRLLGLPATSSVFYACGAFPWMFDDDMPLEYLSEMRQEFIEHLYELRDEKVRLTGLEQEAVRNRDIGRCMKLQVIDRVGAQL